MGTLNSIIDAISSILLFTAVPVMMIGVPVIAFIIFYKKIKEDEKNTGERKLIQEDDRVTTIYKIRKDDPDFDANEVEQYIKNYVKNQYPGIIFRQSGFNIISYDKTNDKAEIVYSIMSLSTNGIEKEYKATLYMDIAGSDDMKQLTKECANCGAVIQDENAKFCPYCGHSYQFQRYNRWKVKEVVEA